MDDPDNIIEQREALLDGVNFICSKLERVHDKKRSNFFLIAQVLITLALPQNKKVMIYKYKICLMQQIWLMVF